MKTGSFLLYRGPGRICIARSAPRGSPAGYRIFKKLAPGPWFNSAPLDEYKRLYFSEVLERLDPLQTWETLHDMAGGAEPVLMCYEKLLPAGVKGHVPGEFCHRRMVAEWFASTLGHVVEEIGAA